MPMTSVKVSVKILTGFIAGTFTGFIGNAYVHREHSSEITGAEKQTNTSLEGRGVEILKYGSPVRFPDVAVYGNHVLHYDQARKIPLWVAEHITTQHVTGDANRRHSKFCPDPSVSEMFTAQNHDYWNSGWSRGHMAPAGNNKHQQKAMDDSFYLTNVLPQDIKNNGDFWNRLEMYCRDLTKRYADVRIISGPLMLPSGDEDGKKYVRYQVIGDNEVAVPTHLYKIVLVETQQGEPQAMGSFVVPNEPISRDHKLQKYQVPLEFIERHSGFKFLPKLARSSIEDLCSVDGCEIMSFEKLELYFIGRRLSNATTLEKLDKVWDELSKKHLKPDEYATNLYNQKKEDLSKNKQAEL